MATDTALQSIELIPEQIKQAWSEAAAVQFPEQYKKAKEIVITGMGGSIYSFYVLEALCKDILRVPLIKLNTYHVPEFVNKDTLFISSSYSGTTEEVNFNMKEAHAVGAMCMGLSAGGPASEYAKANDIPYYVFDPKHNPSGQPRMGQGYMIFGVLAMLSHLGYFVNPIDTKFLDEIATMFSAIDEKAHKLASELKDYELVFVGSEHLSGNTHILRNQTNETAKLYASYGLVPELNHHLMEGLKNPKDKKMAFVFLDSKLYFPRINERVALTKEVVEKNGCKVVAYEASSSTTFGQFVEVLIWGGYFTYYLAEDYQENPNAIPWVDFFKGKLGKMQS